jgi:nucleotide-binding universal stress UspA family protein
MTFESPNPTIVVGYDEIVIGSRGVGRVRALLGSVAYDVIHRARCPVTVIPERMVQTRTAPPTTVSAAI